MKKIKIKTRITWGFNPTTRIVKCKKKYDRKKMKSNLRKDIFLD